MSITALSSCRPLPDLAIIEACEEVINPTSTQVAYGSVIQPAFSVPESAECLGGIRWNDPSKMVRLDEAVNKLDALVAVGSIDLVTCNAPLAPPTASPFTFPCK